MEDLKFEIQTPSEWLKQEIISKYKQQGSVEKISKELNIGKRIIVYWLDIWKDEGSII